jgi:hypothetical protein
MTTGTANLGKTITCPCGRMTAANVQYIVCDQCPQGVRADAEMAQFYANPENLNTLGPGIPIKPRRLDHMMSIRFDPDLIIAAQDAANAADVTLSNFIRSAVRRALG